MSYFFLSVEGLEAGVRPDVVMVEDVVGRAGDDGGVRTLDIGFITERNIPVNLCQNLRLTSVFLTFPALICPSLESA